MEMKNIFKYAVIATALSAGIFSCSEDEFAKDEQNSQVVSVGGLKIQVGDFPSESLRSSVPGFEAGKSAWENEDQIKLTISFDGGKAESYTIVYQNGSWSTSSLPPYPSSDSKIELVAEYSSDRSYKANGVSEYFKYTYSGSASQPIEISFERNYSRLRVWAGKGVKTVTLKSGGFLINGIKDSTALNGLTQSSGSYTEDGINNAYFYGSWADGTLLYINGEEVKMKGNSEVSKSYAIDLQGYGKEPVEVECGVITINTKGADLTAQHIAKALECGGYNVKVEGVLGSETDLNTIIQTFNQFTLTFGQYNHLLNVDLTDLGDITSINTTIVVNGPNSLAMPKSIHQYNSYAMVFVSLNELILSRDTEGQIIYSSFSGMTSFMNTSGTKLILGSNVTNNSIGGNHSWGGVTWKDHEVR